MALGCIPHLTPTLSAPEGGEGVKASYRVARFGRITVAVQPDRGRDADRRATYHDPDLPPCHPYIGFYLWLREIERADALVHLGAHGTLEWLPGKAVALSSDCFPTALLRGLPVIYPFIVSNPGEAAAAKRRLGAVVIGHLTPPLRAAGLHGAAASLERLLEEYAAADGLDRRRAALLRRDILDAARSAGLLAECAVPPDAPETAAITRLDAYLCDLKDLRIRDGLHVFGAAPPPEQRAALLADCPAAALDASPAAERAALLAALDGRFIPPGPAGAPSRGRADVLPTGRNLCAIDPRAVPTPAALALAGGTCAELLRRHVQEIGDWPRRIVLDLWGSATMRTGGEALGLALLLLGVRPLWDESTGRVRGVEVVPLAELDRPRVDVTLRVSGLFRDAFPAQMTLFATAVRMVAARDEAPEWNPLAQPPGEPVAGRIYGPAPGCYGAGEGNAESYLAASAHAYAEGAEGRTDRAGFAACVATADALLHVQDHAETDVLDGPERAAHEAGFAAAAASLGAKPALWHADTSRPEAPRVRALAEEVARVARGRAANPVWIAGMMRHGYRGAAEIARSLDALAAFARALPERFDTSFDLLFDATLGEEQVDRFLRAENPAAREAMRAAFVAALARGLWRPRRNAVAALLEAGE
jgi:cobaltochelatase CobN